MGIPLLERSRVRRLGTFYLGVAVGAVCSAFATHSLDRRPRAERPPEQASEAEAQLDRVIDRVDWEQIPFSRAIEQLHSLAKVDVFVDHNALKAAAVDEQTPISIHGSGVTVGLLLARIIDAMSGQAKIAYGPSDGVILVGTQDSMALRDVVAVYDVRDIVSSYVVLPQPEWETINDRPPTRVSAASEKDRAEALIRYIEDVTNTASWRDNGGSQAVCEYLSGKLVVYAPRQTLREVEQVLKSIRELMPVAPPAVPQIGRWTEWVTYPDPSRQIRTALRTPVSKVEIDSLPLDQALDQLAKLWNVKVVLDTTALDETGLSGLWEKQKLSLSRENISLSDALSSLLGQRIATAQLEWVADGETITVGSQRSIELKPPVVVYNVRDLIPRIGYEPRSELDRRTRAEMIDDLIHFIETSIDPGSWGDNGGFIGRINQMYGELIVRQSLDNHRQISRLLQALREHGITLYSIQDPTSRPMIDSILSDGRPQK